MCISSRAAACLVLPGYPMSSSSLGKCYGWRRGGKCALERSLCKNEWKDELPMPGVINTTMPSGHEWLNAIRRRVSWASPKYSPGYRNVHRMQYAGRRASEVQARGLCIIHHEIE